MFNNPLNSFHDTVAEAKDEREQLDRLLTISTPRERLLIVVIAIFLALFTAWLLLGNAARSLAVDGVVVGPGDNLSQNRPAVQVLIASKTEDVSHFKVGTSAQIELSLSDGKVKTLVGEVISITAAHLSEDLAAFDSSVPLSLHRINMSIDEILDFASISGLKCRIVFQLEEQSPISVLLNQQN